MKSAVVYEAKQDESIEKREKLKAKNKRLSTDSDIAKLFQMDLQENRRKQFNCNLDDFCNMIYLLRYHQEQFQNPFVEYYNPRKGLEYIDGNI